MPQWSVVLPVHNGEQFLGRALESTLRWLPRDAELRVVDDGSTDSTAAILGDWATKDRRLVLSAHDRPRGVSSSLNELIAAGDSRFVARMDADDICLPRRWALGLRGLQSADFAFTSVIIIDATGRPLTIDQPGRFSPDATPFHLLLGCGLVHPTAMFTRAAFDRVGGYANTRAEDYDLWLRAASMGERLIRLAMPGLAYRRHGAQLTAVAPWVGEGVTSTLWRSYQALADQMVTVDARTLQRAFAAVLHGAVVTPEDVQALRVLLCAILERSQSTLGLADRALLKWRAGRVLRRLEREVEAQR